MMEVVVCDVASIAVRETRVVVTATTSGYREGKGGGRWFVKVVGVIVCHKIEEEKVCYDVSCVFCCKMLLYVSLLKPCVMY